MKPPTTLTARRTLWAEHVQAWRSSGLTQVAYCEQHQLNTKSFGYWFRSRELGSETLTLVPIAVHEPAQISDYPACLCRPISLLALMESADEALI